MALLIGLVWQGCSSQAPTPGTGAGGAPGEGKPADSSGKGRTAGGSSATRTPAGGPRVLFPLPEFELTDQAGAKYGTRQLLGRAWVGNFVFTRCKATCPVQTAKLADFQRQARRWPDWSRVRLVSISVDPEFDTPAVLADYASGYRADESSWKFLTGEREAIWKLSKEGFKLPVLDSPDDGGPITHSPKFVLVDPAGRVRGFYDSGDDRDVRQLAIDLRYVLEETPDPEKQVTHVVLPREALFAPWLEQRAEEQRAGADQLPVEHRFQFTDRRRESGITFRDRVVGDAARHWKMNHYDHGTGLVAADVDADGRTDLFLLGQIGGCELWRNVGEGRFEEITERAGVRINDRVVVSAAFADTDNDGDPDLFVTSTRGGNLLFLNDGQGSFQDATEEAGLGYVGHSSSAEFFDYDRDGRLDLFVTNVGRFTTEQVGSSGGAETASGGESDTYYVGDKDAFVGHLHPERSEPSLLYHNEGENRFREVAAELGIADESWSGDATPLDANDDGWIDLYVLNMQGSDVYYENQGGRGFERKTSQHFPRIPWGGMGIKSFDYNNDSLPDLLVTSMHVDMWENLQGLPQERRKTPLNRMPASYLRSVDPGNMILGNALLTRDSGGVFVDRSDETNTETYWPWGVSTGDLNADGFADIFVTASMNLQYRYHPNNVLLNDGGKRFVDAEFVLGVEPRAEGQLAVPWFECDCDGADRNHPACRDRTGRIQVWGAVGSRSSLITDLDGDGDLEIVTGDFNSAPQVLFSSLMQDRPATTWLEVKLRGRRSNRDGLGATVKVTAGELEQTQVHDGQSGYLSQSSLPMYFGLAGRSEVDRITIVWPSGLRQVVPGPLPANQRLTVEEPAGEATIP